PVALAMAPLADAVVASGLPAGVVNLLTGLPEEVLPWLADGGPDVLDVTGAPAQRADLEARCAGGSTRVVATDGTADLRTATAFCDLATVWQPAVV
ncbi:MAG: aldehyde dehydrogenase, partial [Actinomycetota bacterium]